MENINLFRLGGIIGKSHLMQKVYDDIFAAARTDVNVMVLGESGTGKELVAREIHRLSASKGEFLSVNCGAVPESLAESEFFGHKKGTFTGAASDKAGYIERALSGTLFLDEVGEISLSMQIKLLRVLDLYDFNPLGSSRSITPQLRFVTATNKKPEKLVAEGHMREDFYYRINVVTISLPPLRERKEDITELLDHFLLKYNAGFTSINIPNDLVRSLYRYDWPGNIRELQNAVKRYIATGDFGITTSAVSPDFISLEDEVEQLERKFITEYMRKNSNRTTAAADDLGINLRTLQRKIKKYNLQF